MDRRRLSLQYHEEYDEFWRILKGSGRVTIGEDVKDVKIGDSFNIPRGVLHRIEAGDDGIEFLEVGTGNVEEADIVKVSDDFGRD